MPKKPIVNISVIVTIALACISGVAWAVRSGQRATEAYDIAQKDHDDVVELKTIVPRIELKLQHIEDHIKAVEEKCNK